MHRKMCRGVWCKINSHINQYVIFGTIFAIYDGDVYEASVKLYRKNR